MSAYTTQAAIQARIAPQWLAAAFNDDGTGDVGSINTAIANLIMQVSADIDGRLAMIYAVPFNPIPPTVAAGCLTMCCHWIYGRRLAPEEKNIYEDEAKEWRLYLKMIAKDELTLDATRLRAFPPINFISFPLSTVGTSR